MPQEILLQVLPQVATDADLLKNHVAQLMKTTASEIQHITILKRSIDARQKQVKINLKMNLIMN